MFPRRSNIKCSFNFHVTSALNATVLRHKESCDANALRFFFLQFLLFDECRYAFIGGNSLIDRRRTGEEKFY